MGTVEHQIFEFRKFWQISRFYFHEYYREYPSLVIVDLTGNEMLKYSPIYKPKKHRWKAQELSKNLPKFHAG